MKLFIIEEAKKHSWKFLIPAGILLSLTGFLVIVGIPVLVMGFIDLFKKIHINHTVSSLGRRLLIYATIIGIPILILANFMTFLWVFLWLILAVAVVFILKIVYEYGKSPKNLI